jgi:hypothetical protein
VKIVGEKIIIARAVAKGKLMLFMGILFLGISIYMFVMPNEIAAIIAAVVTFITPLSSAMISTRMLVLNFKTGTVYAVILGNKAKSRLLSDFKGCKVDITFARNRVPIFYHAIILFDNRKQVELSTFEKKEQAEAGIVL